MIAPILDEVAGEFDGRVTIGKLNIDQNAGTPPKFGIRGIQHFSFQRWSSCSN